MTGPYRVRITEIPDYMVSAETNAWNINAGMVGNEYTNCCSLQRQIYQYLPILPDPRLSFLFMPKIAKDKNSHLVEI